MEEQESRRGLEGLEDQTSGNLESIAESNRWEEESDADSGAYFKKRQATAAPEKNRTSWALLLQSFSLSILVLLWVLSMQGNGFEGLMW